MGPRQIAGHFKRVVVTACAGGPTELLSWEGLDTDNDGTLDCTDEDDDNDGLRDYLWVTPPWNSSASAYATSEDPCPVTRQRPGTLPNNPLLVGECTTLAICSGSQPTIQLPPGVADGGIFVRFGQHVNPNPEGDFLWDNVRLAGGGVILDPGVGVGVSQMTAKLKALGRVARINGNRVQRANDPDAPESFRVELWIHGTNGGPARLLQVLGDFDPNAANIVDGDTGAVLTLVPASQFGGQVSLAGVWGDEQPAGSARSDADFDGMPDGFEIRTGFNPRNGQDGLADTDGDGRRNFEEFLAGTNPLAVDSVPLRLNVIRLPDGRLRFTWQGGATIRLQRLPDLQGAPWEDVPGTDGEWSLEPGASEASGFFRLAQP